MCLNVGGKLKIAGGNNSAFAGADTAFLSGMRKMEILSMRVPGYFSEGDRTGGRVLRTLLIHAGNV